MIEPKEINKVAAINRVSDRQIEKDYVLSWVLFAISKNKMLNKALVFKGGTVLKKAYFEDYRFSEDLDFTLIDETVTNEQILAEFNTLFDFIKEEANMDMRIEKMTALMGRTEPRDLYDFWYLTEIEQLDVAEYIYSFNNKAEHKKHNPKKFMEKVLSKEAAFKRDWERKLASQIHDIPEYAEVFRGAKRYFKF